MEIIKKIFTGRKKLLTIPVVVFLGLFLLSALTNPSPPKPEVEEQKVEATSTPVVEGQQTEAASNPNPNRQEAKVTRVIDGDTIEIEGGQRVRYIGMDTPETYKCFYSESTAKNKELVEGKTIGLEKDVSETDRYGRLLRYVYVGDIFVNEVLAKEGYAQVSTYPPDVKYQDRFLVAQTEARDNNRGLWSSCQATPTPTYKPVSTPKPVTTTPKPATSSQTQPSNDGRSVTAPRLAPK